MLHALERTLNDEPRAELDIDRLNALRYKLEREVMNAQVEMDFEADLAPNDAKVRREEFFSNWEPSEYDPNK
jgi:hypothetical protein